MWWGRTTLGGFLIQSLAGLELRPTRSRSKRRPAPEVLQPALHRVEREASAGKGKAGEELDAAGTPPPFLQE